MPLLTLKIEKSFGKLYSEWARLYDATPEVSPFLHPKAMEIAVRYFWPYYIVRRARPVFMVFYENDVVRAIIPLLKYHNGRLQLFGDANGFNESGFLFDSKEIILDVFRELQDNNFHIEFLKIDVRSPLSHFIPSNAISTSNAEIRFGDDFQSYFGGLSKSVRQNIRTAYNRLSTDEYMVDIQVFNGGGVNCR